MVADAVSCSFVGLIKSYLACCKNRRPRQGCDIAMTSLRLRDGKSVEILVRRSARARRILLHVDVYTGAVELVLPRRTSLDEGLGFARSKGAWLQSRLKE